MYRPTRTELVVLDMSEVGCRTDSVKIRGMPICQALRCPRNREDGSPTSSRMKLVSDSDGLDRTKGGSFQRLALQLLDSAGSLLLAVRPPNLNRPKQFS